MEDDPDLQVIASFALKRGGFDFEVCGDGREALEKTATFRPELILLDVMLPFLDGPSILKTLRRTPQFAATQVIFMTARVQPEDLAEYRQLGCIDVIMKPFDPMTLAARIQDLWDQHYRHVADDERSELAELEQLYLGQLPLRLAEIERVARLVRDGGDRASVETLFHLSHRLTGSSATLGFAPVSEAARALETVTDGWRLRKKSPSPAERKSMDPLLRRLRKAAGGVAKRPGRIR